MSRKGTKPGTVAEQRPPGNASSFADREREALETLGTVPEPPPKGAADTVKLSTQTWQPPPRKLPEKIQPASWKAPQTVKVAPASWRDASPADEDAVTDIRAQVDVGEVVTGEESPEAAGEIGTDEDQPVRIVSVPPSDLAAVKLPGVPARATDAPRPFDPAPVPTPTTRSPVVPMPERVPTPPPISRPATPAPLSEATPEPAAPFGRELTPAPRPMARHASRPVEPRLVDPTMILRIQRGPGRAIFATAVIASLVGLGAGYGIWGARARSVDSVPPPPDSKPAPAAMAPAPPPAKTTCALKLESEPSAAEVSLDGEPLGETPIEASIPCAAKEITLVKKRFLTETIALDPATAGDRELSVELKRPTYEISIKTLPAGANVWREEEDLGPSPVTVEVPAFTRTPIVVKRSGYRDLEVKLYAKKKASSVTYRLRKKR